MAVDHVKSAAITNLDATPRVPNTAGQGATGRLKIVDEYVTAVASSSTDATYQFVRVPSTAIIKELIFESEAQAGGTVDIGVYYATDGERGQPSSLLAAAAIDQDFFASAIAVTAAVARTDITNESTTYTLDKRNMPLWQALGLSSDPGGHFDIVGTIVAAITTGTGKMGLQAKWVE